MLRFFRIKRVVGYHDFKHCIKITTEKQIIGRLSAEPKLDFTLLFNALPFILAYVR